MLFSRWLARTTKRTLCSPTSTVPHAILPSHEGPSPPPSPRRSVKDVLTTPRKGCHETEQQAPCVQDEPAIDTGVTSLSGIWRRDGAGSSLSAGRPHARKSDWAAGTPHPPSFARPETCQRARPRTQARLSSGYSTE